MIPVDDDVTRHLEVFVGERYNQADRRAHLGRAHGVSVDSRMTPENLALLHSDAHVSGLALRLSRLRLSDVGVPEWIDHHDDDEPGGAFALGVAVIAAAFALGLIVGGLVAARFF